MEKFLLSPQHKQTIKKYNSVEKGQDIPMEYLNQLGISVVFPSINSLRTIMVLCEGIFADFSWLIKQAKDVYAHDWQGEGCFCSLVMIDAITLFN